MTPANTPQAQSLPRATDSGPRHPVATAIGLALVPVVFTAIGSAVGQSLGATPAVAALVTSAATGLCAVLGLLFLRRSPKALSQNGFGRPQQLRRVAWAAPALLTPLVVLATTPPQASAALVPGLVALSAGAAFNEEIWFRGLVLTALRHRSARSAVLWSAGLFGVLHLANLLGGEPGPMAVLQVVFAAVFGVVAAELAVLTRSLWPAIAWHFCWDLASFLGGDEPTTAGLVGLGVVIAVLLGYAAWLWRRLPA